jgi:hypothetical protein
VQISLTMDYAILNAAGLSFIGLGISPPTPKNGASWFARTPQRASIVQDAGESLNPRFSAAGAIADPLLRPPHLSTSGMRRRRLRRWNVRREAEGRCRSRE